MPLSCPVPGQLRHHGGRREPHRHRQQLPLFDAPMPLVAPARVSDGKLADRPWPIVFETHHRRDELLVDAPLEPGLIAFDLPEVSPPFSAILLERSRWQNAASPVITLS